MRRRSSAERRKTLIQACITGGESAFFFDPRLYFYYVCRAAVLATGLRESESSALARAALCLAANHHGRHALARRFAVEAERLEADAGLAPERATVRQILGVSFYQVGDLAEAEAQLMRGHALVETSGEPVRQAIVLAILTLLLIHVGKTEQARRLGKRMVERGELLGTRNIRALGRSTMCIASYYEGDYDQAAEWAEALLLEERIDGFSRMGRALLVESCRLETGRCRDLSPARGEIDRWQRLGFLSVNLSFVMMATVACIRAALRTGAAGPEFVAWLSGVCRRERPSALRHAAQTSLYLGVVAARDALLGRRRKAAQGFEHALRVAHRVGVVGDAWLIERLARSLTLASFL